MTHNTLNCHFDTKNSSFKHSLEIPYNFVGFVLEFETIKRQNPKYHN